VQNPSPQIEFLHYLERHSLASPKRLRQMYLPRLHRLAGNRSDSSREFVGVKYEILQTHVGLESLVDLRPVFFEIKANLMQESFELVNEFYSQKPTLWLMQALSAAASSLIAQMVDSDWTNLGLALQSSGTS
jgi:hypothetical protein